MERKTLTTSRPHRSGVALIMVIAMMGLCACLGYAMLYGASTDAQAADNAVMTAQADVLAESGVNLAMYYLRFPAKAPANFLTSMDTYTASNIRFGSDATGYTDLTVVRDVPGGWEFTISSTGVSQDGPLRISQTIKSTVTCKTEFQPRFAVSAQGNTVIRGPSMFITGNTASGALGPVQVKGTFGVSGNPTLQPATNVFALALSTVFTATPKVVGFQNTAPTWAQLKTYGPQYTYDGQTYNAEILSAALNANPPAANIVTNPLKVYYCDSDLTVFASTNNQAQAITIDGTLVVNGRLIIARNLPTSAGAKTLRIESPVDGAPALVVKNDLAVLWRTRSVSINGLVWIGEGITGDLANNASTSITISGAMLTPQWPATRTFAGTTTISYNATRLNIPDFSAETNQVPAGIQMRTFGR